MIILASRTTFAYVIVLRDMLRLGLFLDRALEGPHLAAVQRRGAAKVDNVIELRDPGDVDDELHAWLTEACALRS